MKHIEHKIDIYIQKDLWEKTYIVKSTILIAVLAGGDVALIHRRINSSRRRQFEFEVH